MAIPNGARRVVCTDMLCALIQQWYMRSTSYENHMSPTLPVLQFDPAEAFVISAESQL